MNHMLTVLKTSLTGFAWVNKTKAIVVDKTNIEIIADIKIENHLDQVKKICYLGSQITND